MELVCTIARRVMYQGLMQAVGALLSHVNLKLFLRAVKTPLMVPPPEPFPETYALSLAAQKTLEIGIAKNHAAEMSHMAYPPIASTEGAEERDGSDDHHEIFRFDGEEKTEQHDAVGVEDTECEQQTIDGSGSSDCARIQTAEEQISENDADAGTDAAQEIVLEKRAAAPGALEVRSKHPQREHVEQNVPKAVRIVEEHVADQLPEGKGSQHRSGNEPEGMKEGAEACAHGEEVQQEQSSIADQQPFHCRWEVLTAGRTGRTGSVSHIRRAASIF